MKDIVAAESLEMKNMAKKLGVSLFILGSKEFQLGEGSEKARHHLESRQFDGVYDLEGHSNREFMHHRNSGLNQVLCKIACGKKKIVVFNVGSLIGSSGQKRALMLGRMQQNVMLCRKYKVTMALATFAKTPYQMRRQEEMIAIGELLGMTRAEAKEATMTVGKRLVRTK